MARQQYSRELKIAAMRELDSGKSMAEVARMYQLSPGRPCASSSPRYSIRRPATSRSCRSLPMLFARSNSTPSSRSSILDWSTAR
jgi:hypothetical protein